MKKSSMVLSVAFVVLSAVSGAAVGGESDAAVCSGGACDYPLKDVYPFKVGTCLNQWQCREGRDPREDAIIRSTFNAATAENVMKPQIVAPFEGTWNFVKADEFVRYCEERGISITGHTLVWHSQAAAWMFKGPDGKPASRELLLERMKAYIGTVMKRYKGRVKGWDVVNEAFGADGTLHPSPWRDIIGEDFVELAFRYAHEADPDAELYYNDFGMDGKKKVEGVCRMIRDFKRKGIRIDGVGMQSHHHLTSPDLKDYEDAIRALAAEGVRVHVTELDVSALPSAWGLTAEISTRHDYKEKFDPYKAGLPPEKQLELSKRYTELFKIYLRNAASIDRVTFWGFADGMSWLNDFPVRGRTDHPLLFDRQLRPKPVLKALYRLGKER